MKTGTCPKCQSQDIYVSDGSIGGGIGGRDHALEIRSSWGGITYDWQTLLCTNCGYYENYLLDSEKIASIKANPKKEGWKKLGN